MQTDLSRPFRLSKETLLVFLAIFVGLGTAILVYAFRVAISIFGFFFNNILGREGIIGGGLGALGLPPELALLLTLPLAGFIVGLIMHYYVGQERYRGVPAVIESVALAGGRIRYAIIPFKALASAFSLGSGASLGAEDPSVQIGASLGSFLGRRLRLSEERTKLIVAAGAASATAASFNAPIAGVFFAIEIILGEFSTASLGMIILAAVTSSAFTQSIHGTNPLFGGMDYVLGSPAQLPLYALLGVLLAAFSWVALRFFNQQADLWASLDLWPPLKPTLAGLLVAVIGVVAPPILGTGEDFMHDVLVGDVQMAAILLILLAFIKLVTTSISQQGGFVGGVFAPTLFMGIILGSAYGRLANLLVPLDIGNPQSYAIAGMAGLLAGIVRAPITAILLVFELTDDYLMILPIMLTAVMCSLIMEWTGPAGIYMGALLKRGVRLQQGRDIDIMQGVRVGEAMETPAPIIQETATLAEMRKALHDANARALCVVGPTRNLTGIATLGDLQRAYEDFQAGADLPPCVSDICTREVLTIGPTDSLWQAARQMGARDIGRLPVLDDDGKPVGLLRRQDLVKAYNLAISRKFHDQHYAEQIRLNTLTGAHILEYAVHPHSPVAQHMISEVQWPSEAVIASITRHGKLLIPHGNTVIRPHDRVTVVTDPASEPHLERIFGDRPTPKKLDPTNDPI